MAHIDRDEEGHLHAHRDRSDRPVIVREERGGFGWLATLLTLLLIAAVLWATGILDIDLSGDTNGDTLQGGGTFELGPPNDNSPPYDSNIDLDPNDNSSLR